MNLFLTSENIIIGSLHCHWE